MKPLTKYFYWDFMDVIFPMAQNMLQQGKYRENAPSFVFWETFEQIQEVFEEQDICIEYRSLNF